MGVQRKDGLRESEHLGWIPGVWDGNTHAPALRLGSVLDLHEAVVLFALDTGPQPRRNLDLERGHCSIVSILIVYIQCGVPPRAVLQSAVAVYRGKN